MTGWATGPSVTAGAPFASTRWDEIVLGLFQGGHDWIDPVSGRAPVIVGNEFDAVFSLFQRPTPDGDPHGHGPAAGVEHMFLDLEDGILTPAQLADVREMADLVLESVRAGKRTLVRCWAGYNRSGLVVAFVLLRMGFAAQSAIRQIRTQRSRYALCNDLFVIYIVGEEARLQHERTAASR